MCVCEVGEGGVGGRCVLMSVISDSGMFIACVLEGVGPPPSPLPVCMTVPFIQTTTLQLAFIVILFALCVAAVQQKH